MNPSIIDGLEKMTADIRKPLRSAFFLRSTNLKLVVVRELGQWALTPEDRRRRCPRKNDAVFCAAGGKHVRCPAGAEDRNPHRFALDHDRR